MSQLKVNALVSYSGNTVTLGTSGDTINVASGVTFNTASATVNYPAGSITNAAISSTAAIQQSKISGSPGFRNIVINGDMSIDQRNNGASLTIVSAAAMYPVDRFAALNNTSQATTNSVQRVADAPSGFKYSAKFTTGTGGAATASQQARFFQTIEGNNMINLSFGTASAKTISLSFYVKASQTGTFGGSLREANGARSYPFTYTISSGNTWEYKTIVIPGDTSGTWATDNAASMNVFFDLGSGSNFLGTAGAWTASNFLGATGGTSTVAVTGATWQITGVQLEAGTSASDFEFLPVDVNLGRCLRYFEGGSGTNNPFGTNITLCEVFAEGTLTRLKIFGNKFMVTKRATPTVTIFAGATYTTSSRISNYNSLATTLTVSSVTDTSAFNLGSRINTSTNASTAMTYTFQFTADAEL